MNENYNWADELLLKKSVANHSNIYDNGDIVIVKKGGYKQGSKSVDRVFIVIKKLNKIMPFEYALMLLLSRFKIGKHKIYFMIPKVYYNSIIKTHILKTNVLKSIDYNIVCKIGRLDGFKMSQIEEKYYLLINEKVVLSNKNVFIK